MQYKLWPLSYSLRTDCVFIPKFLAATKKMKTNYTFFVKPTCFLKKINGKFFNDYGKVDVDYIRKILTFCKSYSRGVFRSHSNIYSKAFLWFFSQRISTANVLMGSKYASAYTYIQVSSMEIICIMNIFAISFPS